MGSGLNIEYGYVPCVVPRGIELCNQSFARVSILQCMHCTNACCFKCQKLFKQKYDQCTVAMHQQVAALNPALLAGLVGCAEFSCVSRKFDQIQEINQFPEFRIF